VADFLSLPRTSFKMARNRNAEHVRKEEGMTDNGTYKLAVSRYVLTQKIPGGHELWPKFNASFDNMELGVSRIAEAVYDGHAITTQHKNKWRNSENYLCGQYLGLDFDHEDESSTIDHLLKDEFIGRYASFLYTTISHKPEAPRARAIFLLDTPIMQAKNYVLAASSLLWLFGTADRACRDACRFFYGAPGCRLEMLNNVLPLTVVQRLIGQYLDTGRNERTKQAGSVYHAPTSQQEVETALRLIPPWQIDYQEWVEVLMAIHSAFGEGGYGLAESWGDGKGNEIEKKWASFKATGNTTGAITVATIFAIAKRFGWKKSPNVL